MAAQVEVRPAIEADASAIATLLVGGSRDPDAEDPASPERYAAAIVRIREQGGEVLVADGGAGVVGVCQLLDLAHLQHQGGRVTEIESVHVAADRRGEGVGSRLVEAAAAWASARGCYRVQLTSHVERADAHRFYVANGFVASHVGFKRYLDADDGT
ncbi:MAG TPA: GNAT family N-acetyltransferase [Acidimicrobiales bacterium]|nr:GNAT family N-acetyltransferase [Acidimicrobiales bacterium]